MVIVMVNYSVVMVDAVTVHWALRVPILLNARLQTPNAIRGTAKGPARNLQVSLVTVRVIARQGSVNTIIAIMIKIILPMIMNIMSILIETTANAASTRISHGIGA
jgi:hypothetical protein